ncbi:MAG: phytoene desaturase [Dehalococcoidia bacterium]|nr:phytoene desaturase [Dehalococcoidia bacterium]MQG16391.1 phytoene desaturase [SAR202 cluster bacterium]|tara:strand:- start:6243 stop:7730 length:1488 start_codon:yes stop_codon:yes gene_type:complete
MAKNKHIYIIGAGPGGLATGILLSKSGVDITILERSNTVGGRTSSISENGFKFDLGPTFFLYPQALEKIFQSVGLNLMDEIEMERLDPQYRIIFKSGGHIDATNDIKLMSDQIKNFAPEDANGFSKFMDENREKLVKMEPCLTNPFLNIFSLISPRLLKLLPMVKPNQSLDTYLKRFFKDPRIRLAFSFQSKYLGMSPFVCPSLFSILSFIEYEYGIYHPTGGCNEITKVMARIAKENGVEIKLNEPVEEILFDKNKATGVRTNKGNYRADAIVMNADFARAAKTLIPNRKRKRWTDQKISNKNFSCSTFMLYLGIEGLYDVPHHNIYISEDYQSNLEDIERRHVLSKLPSFYVQNACVTDPSLAPKGNSTLYVLVPVSHEHENIDWTANTSSYRNLIIQELEKVGFTNLKNRIIYEKIITPANWSNQYNIHLGATFNLSHNLKQMLYLRPRNRFEDCEGIYLVGGGTHPGSGLPVIFESAGITSKLIAEDIILN